MSGGPGHAPYVKEHIQDKWFEDLHHPVGLGAVPFLCIESVKFQLDTVFPVIWCRARKNIRMQFKFPQCINTSRYIARLGEGSQN